MNGELEPTPEQFESILESIKQFSERFLQKEFRASDFSGLDEVAARLEEPEPKRAELSELLATLELASSKGMNHLHPGFLAYIPIAGLPISAIADYLAAFTNRYVGVQWASPAMAHLEWNALRWMASIFGYPEQSRGVFTSGGSLANFTALVTARHSKLGNSHSQGRIYMTDQTHHSIERSARVAGIDPALIRNVPTDSNLRMDVGALERMIEDDVSKPEPAFLVVANAGTVNTGAVDPISEIIELAHERNLWVHIDGAYGGAFILTEHGRKAFKRIENADSITVDPHKGLFLSMGMGCVLVRDGAEMRSAHLGEAAYLQQADESKTIPNLSDYSVELTRPFRGLRIWMAVKLFGWEPFADALQKNRDLAVSFYEWLTKDERFEAPWSPDLSTVAFRLRNSDDSANQQLLEAVNRQGRVLISSTSVLRSTYLRACFLSHRSDESTLNDLIESIESALP